MIDEANVAVSAFPRHRAVALPLLRRSRVQIMDFPIDMSIEVDPQSYGEGGLTFTEAMNFLNKPA